MSHDVLIIGGGVIGLTIARELKKRGVRRIAIVDRRELGAEASWAAAGMLAPNIEIDSSEDFHRFGLESLERYPGFAAELFDETGVDIELDRSGTLCVAFDDEEAAELDKIFERQAPRVTGLEYLSSDRVRAAEPAISASVRSGVFYPNDWQVENRKLLTALRRSVELSMIDIVENAEIVELITDRRRVTGAMTASEVFAADITVLATGAWTSLIKIGDAVLPFSVKPIRGQMMSIETEVRPLRCVIFSPRAYLTPRADGRVLVGATVEDVGFDKDNTLEAIETLRDAAVEIVPGLSDLPITEQWAGLRPFAADGMPILGELPGCDNAFIATAHYRNGILLAPRTAEIMADRIVDGVRSEFLSLFGADRFGSSASNASMS